MNNEEVQAEKLKSQIRDEFGRVVYTVETRYIQTTKLLQYDKIMRIIQIILSAIGISGIFGVIFSTPWFQITSAVISFLLLLINSIVFTSNYQQKAQQHREAADQLWLIREEYKSLLTDFSSLSSEAIRLKRDELQQKTSKINSNAPITDESSYSKARKAIKEQEVQSFSDAEIDHLLPESLRRGNRQ